MNILGLPEITNDCASFIICVWVKGLTGPVYQVKEDCFIGYIQGIYCLLGDVVLPSNTSYIARLMASGGISQLARDFHNRLGARVSMFVLQSSQLPLGVVMCIGLFVR